MESQEYFLSIKLAHRTCPYGMALQHYEITRAVADKDPNAIVRIVFDPDEERVFADIIKNTLCPPARRVDGRG